MCDRRFYFFFKTVNNLWPGEGQGKNWLSTVRRLCMSVNHTQPLNAILCDLCHVVWFSKKLEHLDHACDIHIQKYIQEIFSTKKQMKRSIGYDMVLDYIYNTFGVLFMLFFLRPLIGDLQEYQSWFTCFAIVVAVVDDDNIVCVRVSERTRMLHVCDSFDKHSDSSKHGVFPHVLKTCQSEWILNRHRNRLGFQLTPAIIVLTSSI